MYTIEYFSVIKKNEILLFAITWTDLEDITLSEISQTKTDKLFHLQVESKKKKQQNRDRLIENRLVFVIGEEGREMGEIGERDKEVQTFSYKIN